MLVSWACDTLRIIRPSWVDDRGKLVPDYSHPAAAFDVPGCEVQPGASTEDRAGRQSSIVRFTALAPAGTDAQARDVVEYRGVRFAIDGAPHHWRSPTGAVSHVSLSLVDWEG